MTALSVFGLTLLLVTWRPRGLSEGIWALFGATLALLLGLVSLQEVSQVWSLVWNATLSLVAIIIISLILDGAGVFRWAALHLARWAKGSGPVLFFYVLGLTATVSIFFTNDGSVLILTPIVYEMVAALGLKKPQYLAYLMAAGFMADAASLPLPISNLTNILTTDFFSLSALSYITLWTLPGLVTIAASFGVLFFFFRDSIPYRYDIEKAPLPRDAIVDPFIFRLGVVVFALMLLGFWLGELFHWKAALILGPLALFLLGAAYRRKTLEVKALVLKAPWSVVFFSLGMYLVIFGLREIGAARIAGEAILAAGGQALWSLTLVSGFISAFSASVMNNLPSLMFLHLANQEVAFLHWKQTVLMVTNLIGANLGPKMTPLGSLATLFWLRLLQERGLTVSWWGFFRVGIVLTLPVLLITLLFTAGWLSLLGICP